MIEAPLDSAFDQPARRRGIRFQRIDAPPGQYQGRLLPIIIGAALFLTTLDATIIMNALPSMARSLHESPLALNVAITSYLLTSAVFLPLSGWAADRFGARRVFTLAIVVFTIGSLLCGVSNTLWQLVGARAVQGVAGAMLMPVGRLVLLRSVAKSDLVRAMSYVTLPALIGPVLGPIVGGAIVTYASWRWIFFINLPVGLLAVALVAVFVPDIREKSAPKLDLKGFLLTGVGLSGLIFGFENVGKSVMAQGLVGAMLAAGIGATLLYVWHERRTASPMVDLKLFAVETFRAAVVGGFFQRMVIGALPFLLALLLQVGFGMTALQAGMFTFTSAAGALVMKATAQPIIRRFGFRRTMIVNAVIVSLSYMSYAIFTKATPQALMVAVLLTGGFFRSLQFTALNALAFADVEPDRMSRASTLSSMSQPLAQSVGIGLAALLVRLMAHINGDGPHVQPQSITPIFIIIGILPLASLLFFLRLPKDAAAELSGHRRRAQLEDAAAEE